MLLTVQFSLRLSGICASTSSNIKQCDSSTSMRVFMRLLRSYCVFRRSRTATFVSLGKSLILTPGHPRILDEIFQYW